MPKQNEQSYVKHSLAIQIHRESNEVHTIGVALINEDQTATVLLNRPVTLPESFRCIPSDQSIVLSSQVDAPVLPAETDQFARRFLSLANPRISSSASEVEGHRSQIQNRIKLLREALLIAKDWKTRLILQYELDIVLRHANVLERISEVEKRSNVIDPAIVHVSHTGGHA